MGVLKTPGMGSKLGTYPDDIWNSFERLVVTCFAETHKYNKQVLEIAKTETEWPHYERRKIAKVLDTANPSYLMPEKSDIELQTRRAFWPL